jgi:small GTP-binding protein
MKTTHQKKAISARSKNPFNTGSPARGEDFFGRKDIIDSINEYLQNSQEYNFLLYGQRRIGKTSLLRKIQEGTIISILGKSVYFNLQDKARITLNQLLFELADRITKDLDLDLGIDKVDFTLGGAKQFFKTQFLPKVFNEFSGKEVLILLFDEFDVLGDVEDIEKDLIITNFSYHQFIPYIVEIIEEIQIKKYPLKFIFAIGRNYKDLKQERFGQITKFGKQSELERFSEPETKKLLKNLSDNILPFESDAIKKVFTLTAGHPYFTQCLASSAFGFVEKLEGKTISQDIIEQQLIPSIKSYSGGVNWIWRSLAHKDRVILYLMATIKEDGKPADVNNIRDKAFSLNFAPAIDELSESLNRLQNIKIISGRNNKGEYEFCVEYIRKWIVLEKSVEEIEKLFDLINEEINFLLHNARYYFNRKNYEQAQEYYSQILEKSPYHFEALLFLGKCFKNFIKKDRKNLDQAIKWFEQAYLLNPLKIKEEYLELLYRKLEWINEKREDPEKILVDIHKIEPSDAKITGELVEIYIVNDKDISELKNLSEVSVVDLKDKKLKAIPKQIEHLINLSRLNLRNNRITHLSENIYNLKNLNYLNLSKNQLTALPSKIGQLKKLTHLDLSKNQLTSLPWEILQLQKLKELDIRENPLISPPPEIGNQGIEMIFEYLRQLPKEAKVVNEAKLILVGQGDVGKTCLAKRLIFDTFMEEKSTEGLDLLNWIIAAPTADEEEIKLNVWDFGGQEIYHATHQFFLTKQSLYLLVWNARKSQDYEHIYYWLHTIDAFGADSPIILVMSKRNERDDDLNMKELREKFPQIVGLYKIDSEDGRGIPALKDIISETAWHLPHMRAPWVESWYNVRERLEHDRRNWIEYSEFKQICQSEGLDNKQTDILDEYLHDLGVIIHFRDRLELRNMVILNPEWATKAVYKILDTHSILDRGGILLHNELDKIWDTDIYPPDIFSKLLGLMNKFELAYELPDKKSHLVAELLPKTEPVFEWDETNNLRFYYHYDFLPAGVITRFIVIMHDDLEDKPDGTHLCWREGAVLQREGQREGTRSLVKVKPLEKLIEIKINGSRKRELLAIIRNQFDHINCSIKKVAVAQEIPCNCSSDCPFKFDYKYLLMAEERGKKTVECPVSWKEVQLSLLLDVYKKKEDRMKETDVILKGKHIPTKMEISPKIGILETNIGINLKIDLPIIQTEFHEFKKEVTKLDEELDEELEDLEDDLLEITPASEEGKVNKAINKLSLFMKKLKDEDSRVSKIVKGTKKGIELAQKLAVTYNKFAQAFGLEPVQNLFL